MFCPNCQKKIPIGSRFCNICGYRLEGKDVSDKSSVIEKKLEAEEKTWGIHLNETRFSQVYQCPEWAKPLEKENWQFRGVVVWDKTIPRITRLWAGQSLHLLKMFQSTDEWKTLGVDVGIPAMQIYLDNPRKKKKAEEEQHPENKWVLSDEIHLSPDRTQLLYEFISNHEKILIQIDKDDEREKGKALESAYRLLLGDQLWEKLCVLYQHNPEEAIKLIREAFGRSTES
jgi:hypothetical protein